MPDDNPPRVTRHEDFERVYNLTDPRPYYLALQPLDYRAPTVVARFLRSRRETITTAQGGSLRPLHVIDFCCGYGANGAVLNHDLTMRQLYDRYAGDDAPESDADYFAARRFDRKPFEIFGIDIADNAVAYARACGLLDGGAVVNLVDQAVPDDVATALATADIVIESGGVGAVLVPCYTRLLGAARDGHEPWFLMCTRPDWDHDPLWQVFEGHGYVVETVSDLVPYRRTMPSELAGAVERTRSHGRDPDRYVRDGAYHVPLMLARPATQAAALPASELWYEETGDGD